MDVVCIPIDNAFLPVAAIGASVLDTLEGESVP
jgi:hypothetical protein